MIDVLLMSYQSPLNHGTALVTSVWALVVRAGKGKGKGKDEGPDWSLRLNFEAVS